jgi:DnaJ-class molecular chaperone
MIFKDYYKILGLETSRVNLNEVKLAFREQAKKYHPDVNRGNSRTEERFKDINEAYRVLSNPSSKRKYDRIWNRNVKNMQEQKDNEENRSIDSLFSDFFSMFFGAPNNNEGKEENKTKKKIPVKGENIETEINVGIEDAYYGTEKKISLRTVER